MGGESCGQNGKKTGGEVSRRRWARLYDEHGIPRPKKKEHRFSAPLDIGNGNIL